MRRKPGLLLSMVMAFLFNFFICQAAHASSTVTTYVNGIRLNSDVPSQIINGEVMVPAESMAETMGLQVKWDRDNNSVVIFNPGFFEVR